MFLRNTTWLRCCALAVLVLVVNLAGVWPLVSHSAARNVDLFQRYSEFMPVKQALEMAFGAEFCGDAPEPGNTDADWDAQAQPDGKLILLAQAPALPVPLERMLESLSEEKIPGRLSGLPETPPPRT